MKEAVPYYTSFYETCLAAALFLPVVSFLISLLIRRGYAWAVSILAPLLLLISAGSSVIVLVNTWNHDPYLFSMEWIRISTFTITAGVLVNNMSALMLMVVTVVSFLVHLYSIGYMAGDDAEKKYFGMLGLFTFSMLGIVLSDNLLLIFIFWELVGFSSFMLIGHWQHKPEAAAASKKAFLMNRIGDAGFLIGLMILWVIYGTFSIHSLSTHSHEWSTAAALLIFCGVMGKSAQFPLFTWLPDAMEGPTPVSALIHAATMVAAGVFLLARINPLLTPESLAIIAIIGIITAVIAALAALVQNDIKKILAYSTVSQLGLMVTAIGAGAPEAAMLHLFTHAFFKACLFLCAGSIIHVLHQAQHQSHIHFDVQDIRNLGGLKTKLPFTFMAMSISGAALAGIPFFSGFLSKEAIFTSLLSWKGETLNGRWIIFGLAFIVSFLTVIYIIRLIGKVFLNEEKVTKSMQLAEAPPVMRAPIALLALASLWFTVSWNPLSPEGWLFSSTDHSTPLTVFSSGWIILAAVTGYFIHRRDRWPQSEILMNTFYLDRFYEWFVVTPSLAVAQATEYIDRRWIDRTIHLSAYFQVFIAHLVGWFDRAFVDGTVNGMASFARMIGSFSRSFQGGKIQLYVYWPLFAIIIFLIWSLI